jgi:hypothetical protein
MKALFQVINERTDAFVGKRGRIENQVVSLLDQDEHAMINTLDYTLSEDEKVRHSGKLVGKRVHLAITDARTDFGGRLRLQGRILEVK